MQGFVLLAQQVIPQDPDSPTSHSQQNPPHSNINCDELPCVTHQSANHEVAIGMAEQPTSGAPTVPTDAVSFEEALDHVSEHLPSDLDNFVELTILHVVILLLEQTNNKLDHSCIVFHASLLKMLNALTSVWSIHT